MTNDRKRVIAAATAAVIALTSASFGAASAAPLTKGQSAAPSDTDFSARRRHHRGDRAALGAALGVFGAIASIAAARAAHDRYYGYGPHYGPHPPPPPPPPRPPFGHFGPPPPPPPPFR
jgi:hypothetical protein